MISIEVKRYIVLEARAGEWKCIVDLLKSTTDQRPGVDVVTSFKNLKEYSLANGTSTCIFLSLAFARDKDLVKDLETLFPAAIYIVLAHKKEEEEAYNVLQSGIHDYLLEDSFNVFAINKTIAHSIERKKRERKRNALLPEEHTRSLNVLSSSYEQVLLNTFQKAPIAKVIIDTRTYQILMANEKASELYGYTIEQLLNRTIHDLKFPGIEGDPIAELGRSNTSFESVHQTSCGDKVDVQIHTTSFLLGKRPATELTIQNITEDRTYRMELENFSLVTNSIKYGVLITDQDDRIQWVNKSIENIYGYTLEELKGKKPDIFHGPETSKKRIARLIKKRNKGLPFDEDILNYNKSGEKKWVHLSVAPIHNSKYGDNRFVTIISNINKKKVKALEKKLFASINHTLNQRGSFQERVLDILKLLRRYSTFEAGEAWITNIDKTRLNLIAQYGKGHEGRRFIEGNTIFKNASKKQGLPGAVWESGKVLHWYRLGENDRFIRRELALANEIHTAIGIPIFFKDEILGVIVFFTKESDTKEIKNLTYGLSQRLGPELQRRKTEDELSTFFEISPTVLCIAGTDGYFKKINPALSKILGYSREEFLKRPYMDFVHPDDREMVKREIESIISGSEYLELEARFIAKNKEIKYIAWTAIAARSEQLLFAVGMEVTHRKKLEEERKMYLEAIEQQNKKLKEIAWMQSHVIRAPLASMMGLMDLLNNYEFNDEERKDLMEKLNICAVELDKVIGQVVRLSERIEAGL